MFGAEFGADFGALGPSPELLFFVVAGFGLFEGEPLAFEGEAVGIEVTTAEPGDIGAELAEAGPVSAGVGIVAVEALGGGGVLEGEPAEEFIGARLGESFVAEGVVILEALDEVESLSMNLPVAIAAGAPLVEVNLVNGATIEFGGQDGLDLWEGI